MRGDSVRDLYAKSLAVVGLGALAAVGAAVDYWPAAPRVTPVARAVERAVQPVSPDVRPPVAQSNPQPMERRQPIVRNARFQPDVLVAPWPPAGIVEDRAAIPAPPSFELALDVLSFSPATEVALMAPPSLEPAPPAPEPVVRQLTSARSSDNRFVGAFKKTGSSIVKGGAKTGSTIIGAFRAVGNVLKRVV
jgi:hypothetical protein